MHALEFETDVHNNNLLSIPPEISKCLQPSQHVKVILLFQEQVSPATEKHTFLRAKVSKITILARDSLHER
jgi:hypothetical protein